MNHFHLSCTNVQMCIRRGQEGMTRSDWSDICHLLSSFVCSALIVSVCCEHVPGAALSQLSQPQTCHSVQSVTQLFSISVLSSFLDIFFMTLWTKVSFNWYTGCKDKRCKKNDAMLSHNKISCFLISRVLSSDFIRCCCRVKVISQNFR